MRTYDEARLSTGGIMRIESYDEPVAPGYEMEIEVFDAGKGLVQIFVGDGLDDSGHCGTVSIADLRRALTRIVRDQNYQPDYG